MTQPYKVKGIYRKDMKHSLKLWLALALPLIAMALLMTSCGNDDEPKGAVIDYYLNVEEEFLVDGSTATINRFYNPIVRMRQAIRSVYPQANADGADEAVLAACEKEYTDYCEMYTGIGGNEHFTCLFHLVRVVKKGDQIKRSETLRTFVYDINPKVTDIEE